MHGISTYMYHAMQPNAGKYPWRLRDIMISPTLRLPSSNPTALEVNQVASGVLVAASRQSMLQSYLRFWGLDFRQVPKASRNPT